MSFTTPAFAAIRQTILADLLSLDPQQATATDSDNYIRASGYASAVEGLYQHQQWAVRQQFPDTADSDYLERHANLHGLVRKPAVPATGELRVTGIDGAPIAQSTPFSINGAAGQIEYITTATSTVMASGATVVPARAVVSGLAGNQPANTQATFTSSPVGIDGACTLLTMGSGADAETDAALLARLLDLLRQPPRGGSKADWKRWALEVPGVVNAYVFPLRQGIGTVDVCITSSTGAPSSALVQAVVEHIEPLRPVGMAGYNILGPTPLQVPVTATLVLAPGATLTSVYPVLLANLQAYFSALSPGEQVVRSKIEALISEAPGVVDRTVTAPASNVAPANTAQAIELATLGALSLL